MICIVRTKDGDVEWQWQALGVTVQVDKRGDVLALYGAGEGEGDGVDIGVFGREVVGVGQVAGG